MIQKLGRKVLNTGKAILYFMGFFYNILKETVLFFRKNQVGYKVLIMQILFTGVEALTISAILAIGIGAAINIIGASLLPAFGQSQLMYTILIIIITRELGPLLTAFIIIARSGTAIATELGSMVVSHEIEAYISVGINPISYLAVPRFIGVTVAIFILSIYFNIFGLMGSFLIVQFIKPLPPMDYLSGIFAMLTPKDLFSGLIKSMVFGMIVSTIACYEGFNVDRASTEVPVAGIKAVGNSFVLCIIADIIITILYYI